MSWRENTGNKVDWETRKMQLLRSFFADVAESTPIPENKEHAPTSDHPPLPIEDSRRSSHSSLPDLFIEREPKRYLEDHSDGFYDKLELKTKKYMARLERGEPSDNTSNLSSTEDIENEEKKSITANSNKSDYDTINEPNDAIQESSNDFINEENKFQSEDSLFEVLSFEVKADIHANDDDSVNGNQQIGNLNDVISETYTIENNSDESENEDSHTIISCTYTSRTELVDDEEQDPKDILNEDNISIQPMEEDHTSSQEEEIETMRGNVFVTQPDSVQDDLRGLNSTEVETASSRIADSVIQKSEEMFDIQTKQALIHDENAMFEDFEVFRSSTPISKEFCKTSIKRVLRDNTNRYCESKPTKRRRVSTKSVFTQTDDVTKPSASGIDYQNLECESKLSKRRRVQTKSVCTQITDDVTNTTESEIDWNELKDMIAGNPKSSHVCIICTSCKKCERKTLTTSNKVVDYNKQHSELIEKEKSISVEPTEYENNRK